jgi:hypothetical protein
MSPDFLEGTYRTDDATSASPITSAMTVTRSLSLNDPLTSPTSEGGAGGSFTNGDMANRILSKRKKELTL